MATIRLMGAKSSVVSAQQGTKLLSDWRLKLVRVRPLKPDIGLLLGLVLGPKLYFGILESGISCWCHTNRPLSC